MVEIETGLWRVVSSVPTRHLRRWFPGTLQCAGAQRQLAFYDSDASPAAAALELRDGVKLPAEIWAGLDRVPKADQQWLDALGERLKWLPWEAGALERDGALDWHGLSMSAEGVRWRRESEHPAKLWRARTRWGYWTWAWTGGEAAPRLAQFVRLTTDDANRAVFALARTLGHPVRVQIADDADAVVLAIQPWLPRAEYRYLSTKGMPLKRESYSNRWSLPRGRADEVLATLADRLGIEREAS